MSNVLPSVPQGQCFHCLQPLPDDGGYSVTLQQQEYSVCCYGCQAVAETIQQQNLLHFYQFRDTSNPLQVPLVPEELKELKAYDDERLQQQFIRIEADQSRSMTLSVEGMTCSACAWLIEQHVQRLPGIIEVNVNATTERVSVRWLPDQVKLSKILQAIAKLGYRALPFQAATQEQDFKRKRRYYVTRLGVAGIATMQVMMVAIGLYFGVYSDLDDELRQFMWWISFLVSTPVLLYSAQPFYISALRSIQAQRPNMDVPVSVALLSAYAASAYATFINEGEVYFESVAMFTFFLLAGRYFELLAKQKAISAATNLVKLLPAIAQRETANGEVESVAVSDVKEGDILRVLPGSTLPSDGILLSDSAQVNESVLTGESKPLLKRAQDKVLAGSINQQQVMRVQVTATQQDTVLAGIVALQDLALSRKPKLAEVAEEIASKFVVQLLIIASLTFLIWTFIEPSEAFWVTLAVLVATCPCALALAAPTAITGAIHNLNRDGIILRNADVLTTLHEVNTVFVDKTGTLTNGDFKLQQRHYFESPYANEQLDGVTQALEMHSEHPLAAPLQQLTSQQEQITDVTNHTGYGLEGLWHGKPIRIGSLKFVRRWHPDFEPHLSQAQVFLANENQVLAEYHVGDELREDAAESIAALQAVGLNVVMLTGDRESLARPIAERLGITTLHAECLPEDKLSLLVAAQAEHPVMMIGDGINDGPVLAQADISITFGHAADLARTAADVVLMRSQFNTMTRFRDIAIKSRRILRQNIFWALLYNIGILPVAMAGFVTPYIAAIGMSTSSLIVLANSLRLYR